MGIVQAFLLSYGEHWANFLRLHNLEDRFDRIVSEIVSFRSVDNPSLCHGVSGRLEFLMQLKETTGRTTFGGVDLDLAVRAQIQLLEAMKMPVHQESGEGRVFDGVADHFAWTSDFVTITTPDLWVGFLGPALSIEKWKRGSYAFCLSHRFWHQCATTDGSAPKESTSISAVAVTDATIATLFLSL
jgi:hypothetical protein